MRPTFVWALGATGALTAAALWLDEKPAQVVAALERSNAGPSALPRAAAPSVAPLPPALELLQVEPARRDIFAPVEHAAPPSPPPPPLPPPPPSPPPVAPAMTWRYLGSMVTPSGERLVMLARGDTAASVQAGTRLDQGYVVEAIGSDAVRLVYPPLGTTVDIPIPPAPPPSR